MRRPRLKEIGLDRFSKVTSRGLAICEEFCDEVELFSSIGEREEIKCKLGLEYFTPLMGRMVQGGYCCTQVQRDLGQKTCIAWFEPQTEDEFREAGTWGLG